MILKIKRSSLITAVCLLSLTMLTSTSTSSRALLIDDFSTDLDLVTDLPGGTGISSLVFGPGIAGGERDVRVSSNNPAGSPITGATQFLASGGSGQASTEPGGLGQVRLDYDGVGTPFDLLSQLSLDLTDGGLSDRFIFDVLGVTGTVDILINAGVSGGQIGQFWQSPSFLTVSSGGLFEVPFSAFNVVGGPLPQPSFDSLEQVAIFLILDSDDSITIDAICTGALGESCSSTPPISVSAPSSTFLFSLGLLAIFALRKR